ncbi:uncharacterized protein LOC143037903 isoform X1 [Oratosquilla oratoria]|uniref:uncharacterized protein LOC143037903 isoform X1 n=1 Tax=Oratosquilla oratoria TaxID=337810 RepID=UPI003F76B0B0
MHNNTKRWLANYLAGRNAYVSYNGQSSHIRNIKNGVPQGSVLSPTLFNLYMHDLPTPDNSEIQISSYADDITITCTHRNTDKAAEIIQPYLDTLNTWFITNRLKIAPTKSTATLLTNWTIEHKYIPHLYINNTLIPHTNTPKILGVTYDTSMSFKQHITNIKNKCTPRLIALKSITGTTFGQNKETNTTIYKQCIRSVLNYASPAWAPNLSETHHNTLQIIQNKPLKTITGCTNTTPTDHLHHETKVLKVKDHLDMRGTQTLAAATTNTSHPLHYIAEHPHTPRNIKTTPKDLYYTQILSSLPPQPPNTSLRKHIHNHITHRSINTLKDKTLLHARPPDIHPYESSLPRKDRVHLARLRCAHHPALLSYQKRLDDRIVNSCPGCNTSPHTIQHIMEDCIIHNHARKQHNIFACMIVYNATSTSWDHPPTPRVGGQSAATTPGHQLYADGTDPQRGATPTWGSTTILFSNIQCYVFSALRGDFPAITPLLLLLAGDVESNPGTTTKYTCPTCSKPITSSRQTKGSVQCNMCKNWAHLTCTTLADTNQYTNTWTCSTCPPVTPLPPPQPQPTPLPTPNFPLPLPPISTPLPLSPISPFPPSDPDPTPSPLPPQPQPQTATYNTYKTHNINILQHNIDGINTKKHELEHFLKQHNIHIAILQETKLRHSHKTPSFHNYTTIRQDRTDGNGGGLITLIHHSICFVDTSATTKILLPTTDNTTETQSIRIRTGNNSTLTIVNMYIPPQSSPTVPNTFRPQLSQLTSIPDLIMGGDFNAKSSAWYVDNPDTDRGLDIQTQFDSLTIINNTHNHTHKNIPSPLHSLLS